MEARHWRGGLAAAALLAAPAYAQEDAGGADEDPGITVDELRAREEAPEFDRVGLAVRGGLSNYTGTLGGATNAGAFLGVQADVQALRWAGVEFGYEGSFNNFVGGNESGSLWRHHFGALAKVGPVLKNLRPFVGAGFGVSYIDPTRQAEALGYGGDFINEVPLAAGVDYQVGDLMVGARATYRLLGGEDFGPVDNGNLLNAGISLGGRF